MKKLNLLRLLFGAMFLIAATAFTSCVDDNDDDGMPYLEVAPEALTFSAEGVAEGASAVTVKSNRPWTLAFESGADWVTPSATDGKAGTTEVEFSIPASNESRTATLSFQLKNSYGAYFTKTVTIQQGEAPVAGAVSELVAFIKDTHAGVESGNTVPLGYSKASIEAVILANNEYGNNFGKLYVGDNISLPNSAIVLYDTKEFTKANSVNYPVGKKVTLELSGAEYAPFGNLRELKGVTVTVSDDDPVELVIPSLSAATFNSGNYQGQYVRVNDLTPQSAYVGEAWATGAKRKVVLDGPSSTTVQSYMATATDAPDFGMLYIKAATGPMLGTAEQNFNNIQLIPTKPSDVAAFVSNDPILSVDPETVSLNAAAGSTGTFAVTSNGDWTVAKASGDGFTFDPDKGSQNGTVTITASKANETNAEVTLGTLTVTDGTNTKTVTVKQKIASSDILFENFGTNPVSENTDVAQFNDYLRDGSGVTAQTTYTGNKASIHKTGAPDTDAISGPNALWVASNGYFDVNKLKLESGETKLQIKFAAMASNAAVGASDITLSLSGNDGGSWKTVTYELESIAGESKYKWVICNFTLKTAVSELSLRIASSVGTRVDDLSVTTGAGGQEVDLPTSGVVTEPITIPELLAKITATSAAEVIDENVTYTFEGVICGDPKAGNASFGTLYVMTPGATTGGNGISLYNSVFWSEGDYKLGDKVLVTLTAGVAKGQIRNSIPQVSEIGTGEVIVQSSGNAVTPIKVNSVSDISNYFNMPVTIEATTSAAGMWMDSGANTTRTLTAGGANLAVYLNKNAWTTFKDQPYIATTAEITGIGAVYSGQNQILPRNLDDVKNFKSTAPMIIDVTPSSLSWASDDTAEKTVTIEGVNFNGFTLSSLTSFNASVEGTTVKISPKTANTGDTDIKETLTITATGGNDATVALTQLKKSSGGEVTPGVAYVWSLVNGDLGSKADGVTIVKGTPELEWITSPTWSGSSFYFGNDNNKGVQVGSKNQPASQFVLKSTAYTGGVKKIVVNSSGAASANVTLKVQVGSTTFVCDGNSTADLTSLAAEYTFENAVAVEGDIVLTWDNATSVAGSGKAFYIKSVAINPAE